ncbi:MAG: FIST N-terminal domain-containing protein [bacterium]|nr:FIST N-terminal domain-containing protein [bacterium]
MRLEAAVGYCQTIDDSFSAGAKAASMALEKTNGRADAVFVFGAIKYDQQAMIDGINSKVRNAVLIGCSTDGEIVTDGYMEDSVSLIILNSDEFSFSVGYGVNTHHDAQKTAQDAVNMALDHIPEGKSPSICFLFGDGTKTDGASLVKGAKTILGNEFHIVGGLAGDGFCFKETYQYCNNQVITGGAASLLITGDIDVATGVRHGWTSIGCERRVTKVQGNVVYELDGEGVFGIYEDYLGERADELPGVAFEFPFEVIDYKGRKYLRCPVGIDKDAETITFAGEVPEGATVKMTSGTTIDAINAAKEAAEHALSKLGQGVTPSAIFVFNCCARKKVFGRRTQKEIDAIQDIFGKNVPMIGFYTYGEIAPVIEETETGSIETSTFHNLTDAIVVFG